ncbi:MAG TPA: hypothetical protein VFA20_16985 [Myxococcaceae bacterium]|nr:hypothetical protein [Myxococcaceae bacterium]
MLIALNAVLLAALAANPPRSQPPPTIPQPTVPTDGGTVGMVPDGGSPAGDPWQVHQMDTADAVREVVKRTGPRVAQLPALRTTEQVISGLQSAPVPEVVAEALKLIAEIAMDRAKKEALGVLRDQVVGQLCALRLPFRPATRGDPNPPAFPVTCDLLQATSLETLVADPNPLVAAFVRDLASLGAGAGWDQVEEPVLREVLAVSSRSIADSVSRRKPAFNPQDSWMIVATLLDSLADTETIQRPANLDILIALQAAKACVVKVRKKPQYICDAQELVGEVIEIRAKGDPGGVVRLSAAHFAALAIQAAFAVVGSTDVPKADPRERLRAAVELAYRLAQEVVDRSGSPPSLKDEALRLLKLHQAVAIAAIDGNQPQMIASGAALAIALFEHAADDPKNADRAQGIRKSIAVLTAIASYASTFINLPAGTDGSTDRAALLEARKKVIDDLVSATTVREGRANDWVLGLGVPVGFSTGWQMVRGLDSNGGVALGRLTPMPPQPQLSLGLALQRLPGRVPIGLHFGMTALDLGQFTAYDVGGGGTPPAWDTVLSPGLQAGLLVGWPNRAFLVAADLRYAPGILGSQAADGTTTRGAFRFGVTVAYYVPIIDLN